MEDKRTQACLIGERERRVKKCGLDRFRRLFSAPPSSSGFTFVEMIIIIIIVGIIAGVAIFKGWGSTNPNALRVAVDQVITDLRFAQTMAMSRSTNVQVTFVYNSRNYSLEGEARQLPGGVIASVTRTFSFNRMGEYTETKDGYLTLRAGSDTRVVHVYTVTSFVEEN